jgi:hypothetical protein
MRNVYEVLAGKPEGRRPFERPRRNWEDNIRMDLKEIGWGVVDWIHLSQDMDQWRTLVNTLMNLRVTQNAGNFLTVSFSIRTALHGVG